MVATSLTLLAFNAIAKPDVRPYQATLPLDALGGVLLAGVVFALVNATLEEFVFRGVIFEALASQYGVWFTVAVTAALFGLGHLRGYPSGPIGACLAVLFGFLMGLLRVWTGGLALPILAHISADATIYIILVRSASG
jgi:membrane protease YdiL (CAAX protease family)